jgi:DNA replication protein DnaC
MAEFTALKLAIPEQLKTLASEPHPEFRAPEEIFACVPCSDTGWVVIEGKGAKRCECLKLKLRARLLDRIPPEYRGLDLATIEPDASRHDGQASLFAALKANPDMSLLLSGKVGCGKSLVGWLLYKRAIEQERPAVALPLAELLAQYRSVATGGEIVPAVTSADLRDDSRRWLIYLDEFDKARASEFAGEQLFLLMDAIYTYRHQLVITSNLTKDKLRAHWSQASDQYGVSIMRRVLELEGMAWKEMF